jgi:hypothetical protein
VRIGGPSNGNLRERKALRCGAIASKDGFGYSGQLLSAGIQIPDRRKYVDAR